MKNTSSELLACEYYKLVRQRNEHLPCIFETFLSPYTATNMDMRFIFEIITNFNQHIGCQNQPKSPNDEKFLPNWRKVFFNMACILWRAYYNQSARQPHQALPWTDWIFIRSFTYIRFSFDPLCESITNFYQLISVNMLQMVIY